MSRLIDEGVWLETVEITDVKIWSGSFFSNLQTEFREAQCQKTEIIKMRTENELKEKQLGQNLKFLKKEAENEGLKQIMKNNEQLKINIENQKIFKQNQEIEKIKFNAENDLKLKQSQIENKFKELTANNDHTCDLKEIELNIEKKKSSRRKTRSKQKLLNRK
jgi:hypothetical protein